MRSKVNFGHPKWPTAAILSKISKLGKDAYRSEMAKNAIKSDFGHQKCVPAAILYLSEMARNAIESEFRTGFKLRSSNLTHTLLIQISRTSSIIDIVVPSKMAACDHFVKTFKKKSCISIWNGQKCERKWISDIKNGRRQPLCQKFPKKNLHIDLKVPEIRSKVNIGHQNGRRWPFCITEMAKNAIESDFGHQNVCRCNRLRCPPV